jgi:MYXO-CTERM domain-containing protein
MKIPPLLSLSFAALTVGANAALVAYFPLDGMAGDFTSTINDTIDNASHGVTDGTANNSLASWVNDPTRGSVLFSPTGNRFSAGTQDINVTVGNGFTWSLWAKSGTDTAGVVIGTRNGSWHKLQFEQVDGTGFADFNYRADGANNNANSTFTMADGAWHHIAYVGDENGVGIYVDGVYRGGDTSLAATTYNGLMEIGGSSRFSEDVDVFLDEIAIYDNALTEAQIVSLFNGADPTTIPEPSAALLGALGFLALLRRRR